MNNTIEGTPTMKTIYELCDQLNHQIPEGAIVTTPFGCTGILKNFTPKDTNDGIDVNVYIGFNVANEVRYCERFGYYPSADEGLPRFATLEEITKLYSLANEKQVNIADAIQTASFVDKFNESPIAVELVRLSYSQRETALNILKSKYVC